jgi:outer membrane immunogenic protein
MSGGLIGAGVGFNFWQSGPWVAGVAGDLSWADISGSSGVCGANSPLPHACGTTLQSLGTARGVIGYASGPYWLVYGTAGYAGGDILGIHSQGVLGQVFSPDGPPARVSKR